jgi:hypothetical protein
LIILQPDMQMVSIMYLDISRILIHFKRGDGVIDKTSFNHQADGSDLGCSELSQR